MFPECGDPETEAVGRRRTWMVVLAIVPELPTVMGEPLVPLLAEKSLVVETSKLAGGLTEIPAVMLAPEIEKLDGVGEALP
jgi:hypothetical protein